jgi:hypothetical protein
MVTVGVVEGGTELVSTFVYTGPVHTMSGTSPSISVKMEKQPWVNASIAVKASSFLTW